MPPKRKRYDSEMAGPAPKKTEFHGEVVKLTKDGEPDMRFAVSERFVAMKTSQRALGIDLILQMICQHLPYVDLKSARSVNSFWNRIANPIFRKRSTVNRFKGLGCLCLKHCQELIEKEDALPNRNLVVKVPLSVHCWLDISEDCWALRDAILATPVWFSRVHKFGLHVYGNNGINRMLTFLLLQMPGLQELYLDMGCSQRRCFGLNGLVQLITDSFSIPELPTDVKLGLTKFKINFLYNTSFSIDPGFLRHCPKLKTFILHSPTNCSNPASMDFIKSWKRIRSDDMQYENIEIRNSTDFRDYEDDRNILCETLADFINLNQCTSLNLHLNMWSSNGILWTAEVLSKLKGTNLRQLKVSLPHKDRADSSDRDTTLQILKQSPAFSKLTGLTLVGCDENEDKSVSESSTYAVAHNLKFVTCLTLVLWWSCNPYSLQSYLLSCGRSKALQNLTSVHIVDNDAALVRILDNHMDYLFEGLKSFSKLAELQISIVIGIYNCMAVDQLLESVQKERLKGVFSNFGGLTGLHKLRLMFKRDDNIEINWQNALVALFHGYEPHVKLEMDLMRRVHYDDRQLYVVWAKKFTVEEFKEALKTAETLLLTDP